MARALKKQATFFREMVTAPLLFRAGRPGGLFFERATPAQKAAHDKLIAKRLGITKGRASDMATVTDEIKRHNFSGTPTPVKPLEATAHHEAGHAVVSCFLRVRFLFVTILPHKASHSLGRIVYRKSKWFKQGPDDSDRSRRMVEKHIISTLAAQIAETKFLGKRPRYGMQGDNRSAVDLAFSRCGSDRTAEAYLHYCWCVAEDHVNLLWPQISAVAESLLAQKSLTWADVCAVAAKTTASVTKEKSL